MSETVEVQTETLRSLFVLRRAFETTRPSYAHDLLEHLASNTHLCGADPLEPSDLFRSLMLDHGWDVGQAAAVYFAACVVLRDHGVQL